MTGEGFARRWRDPAAAPRVRTEALLAAMTPEEKIAVALCDFARVAHLGVPALVFTDGPNGIRGPENVTAFPGALTLAASFDEQLAAAYGTAVAEEARDTGSNVLLGPAVDIARTPLGGRLPERMGEDPYLTARLVTAEIRAIQRQHVASMVKHFIGNNAETQQTGYATPGGRTAAINTTPHYRWYRPTYSPRPAVRAPACSVSTGTGRPRPARRP
jgi:beta-glucosidase